MSGGIRRTSLTPYAPSMRDPDPAKAKEAARNSFIATGGKIVLINKDWLGTWADRKLLDQLAEKALGVKGSE